MKNVANQNNRLSLLVKRLLKSLPVSGLSKQLQRLKNAVAQQKNLSLKPSFQQTSLSPNAQLQQRSDRFGKAVVFALLCTVILSPEVALAAPWDSVGERVLEIFNGGLARTIAIIAVIACGLAALAGKLSWDWAIKIIVGIVLIFGATAIVDFFIAAAS